MINQRYDSSAPLTFVREAAKTNTPELTLRVVADPEEFFSLAKEWSELAKTCPDSELFSDWAWLNCWWNCHAGDSELRLYLVRDADSRLKGVLPCYLKAASVFGMLDYYELRFLGTGYGQTAVYCDLISAPRDRASVTQLIVPHLLGESAVWDVLNLENVPAESPLARVLPRDMPDSKFVTSPSSVAFVELPPTWDGFLLTLNDDVSRELVDARQEFQSRPGAKHYVLASREDLPTVFDRLNQLSTARRRTKPTAEARFQQSLLEDLCDRGQFKCHCLEINNKVVAVSTSIFWNGTVYLHKLASQGDQSAELRTLALSFAVEEAIASGYDRFDMLAGDFEITQKLGPQRRQVVSLGAYRDTREGRLAKLRRDLRLGRLLARG